jgi:tungstate transport system ATP-binding protein
MFGANNDIDALAGAETAQVLPLVGEALVIRRGGRTILDGVNVRLAVGGMTVFMGPNGAGKSILLRVLAALIPPDSGTVQWAGAAAVRALRPRLGFVFQKPVLLRRSAIANIRHALHAAGCARSSSLAKARDALAFAGLLHLHDSPARLLSGGEQQRLAIARALALEPEVLFLDEPTANLDPAAAAQIENMLRDVSARTKKVVLVTHDIGQARRLASHVAFMHHGRIVETGDAATFFASPKTRAASAFVDGEIVL